MPEVVRVGSFVTGYVAVTRPTPDLLTNPAAIRHLGMTSLSLIFETA